MIDSSAVAKWVLSGEPYSENAVKVKSDQVSGIVQLCAPSFMVLEVANAVWRAIKLGRITQETAQRAVKRLGDLHINLYDLNWSEASDILAIASKLDLAIYDTAYLFLSEKMDIKLVTADDKMYKKANGQFQVLHLKDYP